MPALIAGALDEIGKLDGRSLENLEWEIGKWHSVLRTIQLAQIHCLMIVSLQAILNGPASTDGLSRPGSTSVNLVRGARLSVGELALRPLFLVPEPSRHASSTASRLRVLRRVSPKKKPPGSRT